MENFIVWIVLIVLAIGLFWLIINSKIKNSGGNTISASVYSEFQNQEKRNAMEVVIEMKTGKKQYEQESGKNKLEEG